MVLPARRARCHVGITPVVERTGNSHAAVHGSSLFIFLNLQGCSILAVANLGQFCGVQGNLVEAGLAHGNIARAAVVLHIAAVVLSDLRCPAVIHGTAELEAVAAKIANPLDFALTGLLVVLKTIEGLHRNDTLTNVATPGAVGNVSTDEPPNLRIGRLELHIVRNGCHANHVRIDSIILAERRVANHRFHAEVQLLHSRNSSLRPAAKLQKRTVQCLGAKRHVLAARKSLVQHEVVCTVVVLGIGIEGCGELSRRRYFHRIAGRYGSVEISIGCRL